MSAPRSNPKLTAIPASNAAKRKNIPKDDEDEDGDSGSDTGSDVVRCAIPLTPPHANDNMQSMINVDFDFYNLNPDVDQ
jgi:protein BCP1